MEWCWAFILRQFPIYSPFVSDAVCEAERTDGEADEVCAEDNLWDSRQLSHSAKVISRSLFWSQYLGNFFPHFLSCLMGDTISRNIFHSRRSHTLFLFLSRITKLSVPIRSSSVPHPLVLLRLQCTVMKLFSKKIQSLSFEFTQYFHWLWTDVWGTTLNPWGTRFCVLLDNPS